MIELFFIPLITVSIIFLLGYGLTVLIIPKKYFDLSLWMSPWFLISFLIFFLTIGSLSGFSVTQMAPLIVIFLLILNFYAFFVLKKRYIIDLRTDLLIFIFIGVSIVLNLSPLLRRDKILTTVSMGNIDVISYASTADYLLHNSIGGTFGKEVLGTVGVLLQAGFRWGPSIFESFFLYILKLPAYKLTYLIQVVLYAFMIPLMYQLLRILYKPSLIGLVFVSFLTIFNANLLYILYHVFFGQVIYWGLFLFILIWMFIYLSEKEEENKNSHILFNKYDLILGTSVTVLFFSYHEGSLFLFAPLVVYLIFVLRRKQLKEILIKLTKIAIIALFCSSIAIPNSIVLDYGQAFGGNPNQPIGWQLFRYSIPYANPFEMMGFLSLHNFEPLWLPLAVLLSVIVIIFMMIGLSKSKNIFFVLSYIVVGLVMFYWTAISQRNFWAYNRAVTYILPIFIILFSIGVLSIKQIKIKYPLLIILIILAVYSGLKLNKRFMNERLSVDASFKSLEEIRKMNIQESIYTEAVINPNIHLWRDAWMGYFLYPTIDKNYPGPLQTEEFHMPLNDNNLVVVYKNTPGVKTRVLFKKIIYENYYYQLGKLCDSDMCLVNSNKNLSSVEAGKHPYEDTLLIKGWSTSELDSRWLNSNEATFRLVADKNIVNSVQIEIRTLQEPQKMEVYLNEKKIGETALTVEMKEYIFNIPPVQNEVLHFKLVFSDIYNPAKLGISLDARDLSGQLKQVKLGYKEYR